MFRSTFVPPTTLPFKFFIDYLYESISISELLVYILYEELLVFYENNLEWKWKNIFKILKTLIFLHNSVSINRLGHTPSSNCNPLFYFLSKVFPIRIPSFVSNCFQTIFSWKKGSKWRIGWISQLFHTSVLIIKSCLKCEECIQLK